MIKFFRQIRQSLINQNKAKKYLLYAIGEITLVVIGILIALQINNWNEQKKDRSYEVKMLSEMIAAIEKDEEHFSQALIRIERFDSVTDYVLDISKNDVIYNDSLYDTVFNLNYNSTFQVNSGPYQAIKSSGMDKISNDTLRSEIVNFYDFKLPMHMNNFNHANRNKVDNIDNLLALLGERYIDDTRGRNFIGWKNTPEDYFQKQEFLNILSDVIWRKNQSRNIIKQVVNDLTTLKKNLNLELKK